MVNALVKQPFLFESVAGIAEEVFFDKVYDEYANDTPFADIDTILGNMEHVCREFVSKKHFDDWIFHANASIGEAELQALMEHEYGPFACDVERLLRHYRMFYVSWHPQKDYNHPLIEVW